MRIQIVPLFYSTLFQIVPLLQIYWSFHIVTNIWCGLSSYIKGSMGNFSASALKILPWKNFLYFFLKKYALKKSVIFREIELFTPKKVLIFSKKSFSYVLGNETFLKSFFFFRRELSKIAI